MKRLFIVGFPSEYGGAGSELRHQIHLWVKAFPEIILTLIPTQEGFKNEPLYGEMESLGVTIHHTPLDFSIISKDDAVISFCCKMFLQNLKKINELTSRTLWVNCMTWLFPKEKHAAHYDLIKINLYQRPEVRDHHSEELKKLGSSAEFIHFKPYFSPEGWDFSCKEQKFSNIGRISRQDADKFSKNTLHIYEYITSRKEKRGHFLGFGENSRKKIGNPLWWIKTYENQRALPVKDFYNKVDMIVQPMDTTENLPRIGFEAMFTGTPLVVDNKGGWRYMIEHGVTGFLCDTPQEFIYYGTRLCFEYDLRKKIAEAARRKAIELSSFEESRDSWAKVFEKAYD